MGTHLEDGGQRQLRKRNAVGLAVQVLQNEVIQLLHQAILRQQGRKENVGGGGGRQWVLGAWRSSKAVQCVRSLSRVEIRGCDSTASQEATCTLNVAEAKGHYAPNPKRPSKVHINSGGQRAPSCPHSSDSCHPTH